MDIEENLFVSKDLYLCSFLLARNMGLVKTEKQGKIATFYFRNNKDLENLISGFCDGTGMVEGLKFVESIRRLKNLIYNLK